jgi:hypothetical protein
VTVFFLHLESMLSVQRCTMQATATLSLGSRCLNAPRHAPPPHTVMSSVESPRPTIAADSELLSPFPSSMVALRSPPSPLPQEPHREVVPPPRSSVIVRVPVEPPSPSRRRLPIPASRATAVYPPATPCSRTEDSCCHLKLRTGCRP